MSKKRRKTSASPASAVGDVLSEGDIAVGMSVLIERKGAAELAEVVKPSKKEGMWACRFGDGKLLPKKADKMRRAPQNNDDDDDDNDADAADAEASAAVEAGLENGDEASIEEDDRLISFEKGTVVIAERNGGFEDGVIVGKSKKEGQWKVKFDADGKVFARESDRMSVKSDASAAAADDEDGKLLPILLEADDEKDTMEAEDMVKGLKVIAERKGEMEVGTVQFKSKKGEDKWVVLFEDGKKLPTSVEVMRKFSRRREGRTSGGGAIAPKQPSPPDDSVVELERLAPVLPGGRRLASRYSHDALPPLPPHRCLIFFAEGLFTFGRSFVDAIVRGTKSFPQTTTLVFTEYLTPSELSDHKKKAFEMCLENVRTITSFSTTSQCECLCRLGVDATFCRFGLPAGTKLPRSSALFASGVYAIKDPSVRDSNAIANTRALMTGMMASSASLQEADDLFYLTFGLSIKETASRYRKDHRSDFEWESELQSGWNANGWLESVLDGGEQGELLQDGRACFLRLVMFAPETWMKYYEPRRCGSLGSGSFYRHCQTASVAPVGDCRDFVLELRRSDAKDEDEEKRRLRELCCLVHAAYCQTFWERESQLKGKKRRWRRVPEERTIRDSNRLIGEHSGVRILRESLQGDSGRLLRGKIWNLRKDNLPWE